ncbi:hypothetical protein [Actinomadura macra]|uniref:hypothetical protein n=1 Tax=Actinomadura macra TaxID=46164 RepID=UPI00082B7C1E|nr:hypothetical protein [Actinomadura macra]
MSGAEGLPPVIDAVAAGEPPEELIALLRWANSAGVRRDTLIAEIEAGVTRAERGGSEEGAAALRGLLDRITGFCGPNARIELR